MNRCEGFAEKLWVLHVKWVSEGRSYAFWRMVAHVEMQSVLMHRKWNAMSIDAQPHFRLFNLKENTKQCLWFLKFYARFKVRITRFAALQLTVQCKFVFYFIFNLLSQDQKTVDAMNKEKCLLPILQAFANV